MSKLILDEKIRLSSDIPALLKVQFPLDGGYPTSEDYIEAGQEIFRLFIRPTFAIKESLSIEEANSDPQVIGCFQTIDMPEYGSWNEQVKKKMKTECNIDYDSSKHFIVSIPDRLLGGGSCVVFEFPSTPTQSKNGESI